MNLQEHIRIVLQEETNYLRMISRRLPPNQLYNLEGDFKSSLYYISNIFVKQYKSDPNNLSEKEFIRMVIIDLISIKARSYFIDNATFKSPSLFDNFFRVK